MFCKILQTAHSSITSSADRVFIRDEVAVLDTSGVSQSKLRKKKIRFSKPRFLILKKTDIHQAVNYVNVTCQTYRAFEKQLRKAKWLRDTCLSVRPSVRMEVLGSKCRDFRKFYVLGFLLQSVDQIRVLLKPNKNRDLLYEQSYVHRFIRAAVNGRHVARLHTPNSQY